MLIVDEGVRYRAYKDTVGKTTVGIGFNMDDPKARGVWIQADILESFNLIYSNNFPLSTASISSLVNTNINNCKTDLGSTFTDFSTYPDYVQLALINLMFNMGKSVFSQFVTFIQLIKDNNYDGASIDLGNTKWSSELNARSQRVMALLKGDDSGYTSYPTSPSFSDS